MGIFLKPIGFSEMLIEATNNNYYFILLKALSQ